jgi:hypothetical protein
LGAGLRIFVGLGVGVADLVGVGDLLGEEVGDGVVGVGLGEAVGEAVGVAVGVGVGLGVVVGLAVADGLVHAGLDVAAPCADAAPGRATMAARPATTAMAVSRLIRSPLLYFL